MDDVTLYLGDCLDVLRDMPDGSVDAVVTDPPYCSGGSLEAQRTGSKAQGVRGKSDWFISDNMSTPGLSWLLRAVMMEVRRILRPNTSALLFTDWRMVPHLVPVLESAGVRYRNMLIWDKGRFNLGRGFRSAYEVILEFSKGQTVYQVLNGSNVVRAAPVAPSVREHKTQKPVELIEELLRVVAPEGGTVLDPFMGSGTTGVACVQTGRNFIGIEVDADYYAIAEKRIAEARAQLPLPLAEGEGSCR